VGYQSKAGIASPGSDQRSAGRQGPVVPTEEARVALRPLPLGDAPITGGLWAGRQRVNRETTIPLGAEQLEAAGSFENFKAASTRQRGAYHSPVYQDGEVYKWLEALAWEQARGPSGQFASWQREISGLIGEAQAADGYLNTFIQVSTGDTGRFSDLAFNHEIFNVGALVQAAVAQVRTGNDSGLAAVAERAVAQLARTFGPGKRAGACGHPLIEMALAELSRLTGRREYLDLAGYFVGARGQGTLSSSRFGSTYYSDRVPVRETVSPEGHAVRAIYLAAGATDVAAETHDTELLDALRRQWHNMVTTKMYVTGGLGARWEGEAFGDPFELPSDRAYCETCAAVASIQWSWRLLLLTGEALFADLIERTLFNALLPGVSLGGDRFFYVNALQLRPGAAAAGGRRSPANGRQSWFGTSCCPTNLMRTLSSLEHYFATRSAEGLQLHQYAPMRIRTTAAGQPAELDVATGYPWEGTVEITVRAAAAPWTLALRIPAWAAGARVTVNGHEPSTAPEPGDYLRLHRRWEDGDVVALTLPMPPHLTRADDRIDAVRGCAAIERGPLVYCLEQADQPAGAALDAVRIEKGTMMSAKHPDLPGGVTAVDAPGRVHTSHPAATAYHPAHEGDLGPGEPVTLRAVPYFAWANRGAGPMRVWIPRS
jgi:uncharacterized protein